MNKKVLKSLVMYSFLLLATFNIEAQNESYQKANDSTALQINTESKTQQLPVELDEVMLRGLALTTTLSGASQSVSVITTDELMQSKPVSLAPVINQIPGVFMQSGTLNTNRITIRGIGARSLFGTANIRAYFGEIPLTDGNGESVIEDLELAAISQIEIYKGPAASSFGVGLGGTIILKPKHHTQAALGASLTSLYGNYNLQKTVATIGLTTNQQSFNIIYSTKHSDGYRDNNKYDRNTVTGVMNFMLGTDDQLSILVSYVHLHAQIPSSLSQEDFNNTPRKAAFTWGASKAFEHVNYGILGLTWTHDYNNNLSQHTSVFTSIKDNKEPRPFNILEEQTHGFGLRTKVEGKNELFKLPVHWMLGAEGFTDAYTAQTFENTYESNPEGIGSSYGEQLSDLKEDRSYLNLFAEMNLDITAKLKLNAGLHGNYTVYSLDNQLTNSANDQLGDYTYDFIYSPKLGFTYTFAKYLIGYGSIAHGFSMPTTSESILPDGTHNRDLLPEVGWNFEIGTRFKAFNNKLKGSIALYTMHINDLLVSRRTTEDDFFAINAGKTRHSGIEAQLSYPIYSFNTTVISAHSNVTINQHRFRSFVDKDLDFSGNDLTGVPSEVYNLGITIFSEQSFYGAVDMQYVGEIPVNDGNTMYSKSYSLLNAQIGYKNKVFKKLYYDVFFNLNNIADTKYTAQIQVNATSFGSNAPRYFYPGVPRNYYGGINIKYIL